MSSEPLLKVRQRLRAGGFQVRRVVRPGTDGRFDVGSLQPIGQFVLPTDDDVQPLLAALLRFGARYRRALDDCS